MRPYKIKFFASLFVLLTMLSYYVFDSVPYFDYSRQEADVTPLVATGENRTYEIKDFGPILSNLPPPAIDDCMDAACGQAYNWSVRTYEDPDNDYRVTVKITRFQSHEKAMRNYDNYCLSIKRERFDRAVDGGQYRIFISSVKKLRWDYPSTPNGLFASRVLLLKNNIMIDVLETSKSKQGQFKNAFLAAIGRQLISPPAQRR